MMGIQATGEGSSPQREHPSNGILNFLICGSFYAFLDPDPQTPLNPNPIRILESFHRYQGQLEPVCHVIGR